MLYLTREQLCEFYDVEGVQLVDALLREKQLGTIYYHESLLKELDSGRYLPIVLPVMGEVLLASGSEKPPLLPFPVPRVVYESLAFDEEYLVCTLAHYKLAHVSGDFSQNRFFDFKAYQYIIESILHDYDYLNPYKGHILYWIDLREELALLLQKLPLEGVNDIVAFGRRIKVTKKTIGEKML